jgi:hypothetical protein
MEDVDPLNATDSSSRTEEGVPFYGPSRHFAPPCAPEVPFERVGNVVVYGFV